MLDARLQNEKLLSAIKSYLSGLEHVLAKVPIGRGKISLWTIAQTILLAELDNRSEGSCTSWIDSEYAHWLQQLKSDPAWQATTDNETDVAKLNILFFKKLEGEAKRHTSGAAISSNDDAIFNETDRIVLGLLRQTDPPPGDTHSCNLNSRQQRIAPVEACINLANQDICCCRAVVQSWHAIG